MEQTLTAWLIPAIALVAGIAIGFLIARLAPNAVPGRTQRQLDELQERFDNYQSDVVTHFNTTANLVKKLTQSYQDVQEHLTEGTSQLALDELTRQRLMAALHSDDASDKRDKRERLTPPRDHETPKDYAPKMGNIPGMLDENYGLKSKR
ncbi:YhcB family protein [Pseudomonas sp. NPDC078700]|uniref:YhcB family protein n=1 Tax=Pseudomonas sp. NPDC078700 TaxID=3364424 RepID=UPI0037CA5BF0